jgi:hypothetical protein
MLQGGLLACHGPQGERHMPPIVKRPCSYRLQPPSLSSDQHQRYPALLAAK